MTEGKSILVECLGFFGAVLVSLVIVCGFEELFNFCILFDEIIERGDWVG